jgi:Ulp1 family protease
MRGKPDNWSELLNGYDAKLVRYAALEEAWPACVKDLMTHRRQVMTRFQLSRLQPGSWLDDEAINTYSLLLTDRDSMMKATPSSVRHLTTPPPKCCFFSSFFMSKLFFDNGYNYDAAKVWTNMQGSRSNRKEISFVLQATQTVFDLDLLLFPVNLNNAHWSLAVIYIKGQKFSYYDPMGGRQPDVLDALSKWLAEEHFCRKGSHKDFSSWPKLYPSDIPKQTNGYDCGLFLLMFMDRLGMGLPFDFNQGHMSVFRKKVLHRLITKRLPLWPTPAHSLELLQLWRDHLTCIQDTLAAGARDVLARQATNRENDQIRFN